jgi:general secretion pathway protein K
VICKADSSTCCQSSIRFPLANYQKTRQSIEFKSRGAALILILGILTIISLLAVQIMESANNLATQQAGLKRLQQSYWYAKAGEEYATLISRKYLFERILDEKKLKINLPIGDELSTDRIEIELKVMQNCFNLNSFSQQSSANTPNRALNDVIVVDENKQNEIAEKPLMGIELKRAQLNALFADYDISEDRAQFFSDRLIDWLDTDNTPSGRYGAESVFYTTEQPSRLSPNQHLLINDEVGLFLMDDLKDFSSIMPLLCVRPGDNNLHVNINQLDETNAVLLSAIMLGGIDQQTAVSLIANRPEKGYDSPESFWQQPEFSELKISSVQKKALSVENRYFKVITNVMYQHKKFKLISMIRINDDKKVQVLSRQYGVTS